MPNIDDDTNLDAPIWGAEKIALAAGLIRPDGSPDIDAAYYKLSMGYLPATKRGRMYVSSQRKIRGALLNAPNQHEAA